MTEFDSPEHQASALDAEAAAAEAEAHAAEVRLRALALRRKAHATEAVPSDDADCPGPDGNAAAIESAAQTPSTVRRRWSRAMRGKAVGAAAAILLTAVTLSASGFMAWQHRVAAQRRQHVAAFAMAARQDIIALMSLNPEKASDDMKRIADESTGTFKSSFPLIAEQLTKGLQKSNVATTVTVNDVAVESMTDNSAIVLVAATTEAKVPDGPPQQQAWHISLGLRTEGGRPKMSHVEFVQ